LKPAKKQFQTIAPNLGLNINNWNYFTFWLALIEQKIEP